MARARRKPAQPRHLYQQADGPTDQQLARSSYRRADALTGVDRATIHEMENRLRELEWLGALTARQREAGELFEADYWTAHPHTGSRDSLDMTPRGEDHETEAEAKRVNRARSNIRRAHEVAGTYYPALRAICAFRERVKLAAAVLPPILDRLGTEVYGLAE